MKARYTVGGRGVSSREARVHVRRRDGHDCWICQAPVVEGHPHGSPEQASLDHVIERAAGGSSDVGNLRLAHAGCNGARGERFNLEHGERIRREHRERLRAVSDAVCQRTRAMNAAGRADVQTGMTNPIRIVPMGEDAYAITGLADHDVQVHVTYRVVDDPRTIDNYHASIDGMAGFAARGETPLMAATALCEQFINGVRHPEAMLSLLAEAMRVEHERRGLAHGSGESVDLIAREEAYRAAAQIVHAAKVLAQPTEAQRRLWANTAAAQASGGYPEGVTLHRDGAVTLSGPYGPQGVVARLIREGGWYAVANAKGVRLSENGGPLAPFKPAKLAIGWILANLARFGVVAPEVRAAAQTSPDLPTRLRAVAGDCSHSARDVHDLLVEAAVEIERLRGGAEEA